MYNPSQFQETDLSVLHDVIRQSGLSTLVTWGESGLEASHVPMFLDPSCGPYGAVLGHLSRANGQWRSYTPMVQSLAMFMGPDCYITPSWYPSKAETGRVAPTWNYVAVHAYGDLEIVDDPGAVLAIVSQLTNQHEEKRSTPWAVSDAPPDYVQAQVKGIIGFRLSITRIEGKWKMSQNRTPTDRQGVIDGLTRNNGHDEQQVLKVMQDRAARGN